MSHSAGLPSVMLLPWEPPIEFSHGKCLTHITHNSKCGFSYPLSCVCEIQFGPMNLDIAISDCAFWLLIVAFLQQIGLNLLRQV